MNGSTSGPGHSRISSSVETASVDSRQVLLSTQGQSVFILNPIVTPSSYNNVSHHNTIVGGTASNGLLTLNSLPSQMMASNYTMGNANNGNASQSFAEQNENPYASYLNAHSSSCIHPSQEFQSSATRKEEPVDLDETEIPLSLMQAYNYGVMAQNSLQIGVVQLSLQLKECKKEKAIMNVEIGRLSGKCSQLEENKVDLENLLAGEREKSLKKQQELIDCNMKLDEMREEAKQQESDLQKERVDGNEKTIKIEELEEKITELKRKSEETDKKLQEAKEINRKIVDEYFHSITKQTTLNKLLSEQLAKNPKEKSSQYQLSTLIANKILERYQSQEKNSMIPDTSTSKDVVVSKAKKHKCENDGVDTGTRAEDK